MLDAALQAMAGNDAEAMRLLARAIDEGLLYLFIIELGPHFGAVSYTHLTLPTNREV